MDMHASAILPKIQEPPNLLVPYELEFLQGTLKIQVWQKKQELTGTYQVKSSFLKKN